MPDESPRARERLLDPIDRISEVIFGLIMALSFTGSLSAATAAQEEVRTMLYGAIGCNIAWGLVDGVMFIVARLTTQGRALRMLRALRATSDPEQAHRLIAETLPPVVAEAMTPAEFEAIRRKLTQDTAILSRPLLRPAHFLAAGGVFLLVFLSTFPVALPFALLDDVKLAMRISNGIAVGFLFICGYSLGRYAGRPAWRTGLAMAIVGSVLVGLTIALGG